MRPGSRFRFVLPSLLLLAVAARADWLDDVGATRLRATFADVPGGADLVTQAEAGDTSGNTYLPDAGNAAFAGQTIVNKSPGAGVSAHATVVGQYFYGAWGSLLPETVAIHAYNASGWLGSDFLGAGGDSAPLVETAAVQNHSWISTSADLGEELLLDIDRRLDFAINRDGFVCVAGVNNGNGTTLPKLLAQAYNTIMVGLTGGAHSAGYTTYDGAGRIKPDMVAPQLATSYATPMVAGAAGVLSARARQGPHSLSGADLPRVVKALLLAGATKEEFSAWTRTSARPLDARYGAGELNLLLAYRILESGRVAASSSTLAPETGWSAGGVAGGATQTWFFEIPAGAVAAPFSMALVWHRLVIDGAPGPQWSASPQALVNLDLALYSTNGFTLGPPLDTSASAVDNVEHIYAPALPPGRYAMVVSSPAGAAGTTFALAWRSTPTVTVAATAAEAREQDGAAGEFTLIRAGSTATPLLVPVAAGGSAVSGGDYAALPASVLIPAGAASATVAVGPVADFLAQGDRTVTLAVVGDYSVSAAASGAATVTVRDKPYDAWRFARFGTGQLSDSAVSGDAADPDGDGLPNLLEYALGAEPFASDAATVAPRLALVDTDSAGARLALAYREPPDRPDLDYLVEWSADLTTSWQNGSGVTAETGRSPDADGGEQVVVRAVTPLDEAPRQFLRLRVERR